VPAPRREDESAPVSRLLQDYHRDYVKKRMSLLGIAVPHGCRAPIPGADEFPKLLARLAETISTVAANISTGQAGLFFVRFPRSAEADQKALLHQ